MANGDPNGLDFRTLEDPSDLMRIRGAWSDLWANSNGATLFSSPDWLLTWMRIFWQANWRLSCLAGYKHGELCVLVPLYIQPGKTSFQPATLFPLGQGESSEMEVATEYLDFLIAPGYESIAYTEVRDWISSLTFDFLHWRAAKVDSHVRRVLETTKHFDQRRGLSYLIDKENWNSQQLGRSTRARWRRIQTQMEKLDGAFFWVYGGDQGHFWGQLRALHQRNWESRGLSGAFQAEPFSEFHRNFQTLTDYESSCMSCLSVGGAAVAINYYLVGQDTLYFYQSGWNPDFANTSPGLALHLWSIENSDFRYYDFMMGAAQGSYKKRFGCQDIEMIEIQHLRRPLFIFLVRLYKKISTFFRATA